MKKIALVTVVIGAILLITFSCKKESSNDKLNSELSNTEGLLLKYYSNAKTYDDSLKICVDSLGNVLCSNAMMDDSLYHMNDSLFMEHYLTYCKDMMDGDNMMGGNMMGGDTIHGSHMMGTHTFMADTSTVNQCYRSMDLIRTEHPTHHPKY